MAFSYKNDDQADERANPVNSTARNLRDQEADTGTTETSDIRGGSSARTSTTTSSSTAVNSSESTNGGAWANNVTSPLTPKRNKMDLKNILLKRGAPVGGVMGLIIALVFGIGSMAPALVINHFVEVFKNAFNVQAVGMESASNHLAKAKVDEKTKGFCSAKVTIRCKFSSFSEREVKNLKAQGINFIEPTSKFGRTWPKQIEYKGVTYTPDEFVREAKSPGSQLGRSFRIGVQTRLAGFSDKVFQTAASRMRIDKNRPFPKDANNDENRFKKLKEQINSTTSGADGSEPKSCEGGGASSAQCAKDKEKAAKLRESLGKTDSFKGKAINTITGAAKGVSVLNLFNTACDTVNTIRGVEYATKAARAAQMVQLSMAILKTADMIRAGEATPGDVAYVGGLLTSSALTTKIMKDSSGKDQKVQVPGKSATDAFGYRSAAYGDKVPDDNASLYNIGGFAGSTQIGMLKKYAQSVTPGATCAVVENPFVVATGGAITIVTSIFSGGATAALQQTARVAGGMAVGAILDEYLQPIVISLLAGDLIDKDTKGEPIGNMASAGSATMFANVASEGGNVPLTPEQAVKQRGDMAMVNAMYAEDDRNTLNPLDVTNPNTMIGSIVSGSVPYFSSFSSFSSTLLSPSKILGSAVGNFTDKTKANEVWTAADFISSDDNYSKANFATTKQNVIRFGVTERIKAINPADAYRRLMLHRKVYYIPNYGYEYVNDPHIDSGTGEPISEKYKKFVKECFNAERVWGEEKPPGGADYTWDGTQCMDTNTPAKTGLPDTTPPQSTTEDDCTAGCLLENNKTNEDFDTGISVQERMDFIAFWQAKRVNDGWENEFTSASGGAPAAQGGTGEVGDATAPSDNIPCPAGTKDVGVQDGYTNGTKVPIRICAVQGFPGAGRESNTLPNAGGMTLVNSRAAANLAALAQAMKAAGVPAESASSFRTMSHQSELWGMYQSGTGNIAARPGYSNHQMGIAIDFSLQSDGIGNNGSSCVYKNNICTPPRPSKVYDWLVANASKYGFKQLPKEYWHWSVNGG